MADRPILFSAPMVRALLAGTKTQTRRILKPQPDARTTQVSVCRDQWMGTGPAGEAPGTAQWDHWRRLRYAADDRLWVRETWSHAGVGVWQISTARMAGRDGVFFKADKDQPGVRYWPSIHMPRAFSRLTLTVTDVRVQRLNDISEADAKAEGVPPFNLSGHLVSGDNPWGVWTDAHRLNFSLTWDSINGPGSWDVNPWIVALTFDVRKGNIDG